MYKIGNSTDVHNLIYQPNSLQKLGGCEFRSDYVVQAHSDGDVILHALAESVLGALCLGDLGDHFGDKDPNNKNLNSIKILDYALEHMKQMNYQINNVDLTIICEKIFFKDKKKIIKDFLVNYLKCDFINIKATRFEEKENNKIVCQSTVLLTKIDTKK